MLDDFLIDNPNAARGWERDQVRQCAGHDLPELAPAPQRARRVGCDHPQDLLMPQPRVRPAHQPHLFEEAERIRAREAVGPEAEVYPEVVEAPRREGRMTEIPMAPRAMDHV